VSIKLHQFLALTTVGIAVLTGNAQAALGAQTSYSNLVVFGDSISDTGNVLSLTKFGAQDPFPSFPSAPGRFSDGIVWTEYLATGLGLPFGAVPANLLYYGSTFGVIKTQPQGGTNYAYGGARTGLSGSAGATTGLIGELFNWNGAAFASSLTRAADPNALYVVMAGANDLRDIRSDANLDAPGRAAASGAIAQNIVNTVGLLAQAGAQHFLISSLPDLGKTPEASLLGLVPESTGVTLSFNAALAAYSAGFDAQFFGLTGRDLDIRTLDFYGLVERVAMDAQSNGGQVYGITNITTPCLTPGAFSGQYFFADATGSNCAVAAFSDPLHPSNKSHQLLGALALATATAPITTAVPEPSAMAMLAAGLMLIGVAVRRTRKAA